MLVVKWGPFLLLLWYNLTVFVVNVEYSVWNCTPWGRREAGWSVTFCWDSGGNLNGLLLFKLLAVLCAEVERLETAIFLPGFLCDLRKLVDFWQFDLGDEGFGLFPFSLFRWVVLITCKRDRKKSLLADIGFTSEKGSPGLQKQKWIWPVSTSLPPAMSQHGVRSHQHGKQ